MATFPFATPMPGQPSMPAPAPTPRPPVWKPILDRIMASDRGTPEKAEAYINSLLPKMNPKDRLSWQTFLDEQKAKRPPTAAGPLDVTEETYKPPPQPRPPPVQVPTQAPPIVQPAPQTVLDPGGNQPLPQPSPQTGELTQGPTTREWQVDDIFDFMGPIGTMLKSVKPLVESTLDLPRQAMEAAAELDPRKGLQEQEAQLDKVVEPAFTTAVEMLGAPAVPGAVAAGRARPPRSSPLLQPGAKITPGSLAEKWATQVSELDAKGTDPNDYAYANIMSAGARTIRKDQTARDRVLELIEQNQLRSNGLTMQEIAALTPEQKNVALGGRPSTPDGYLGTGMSIPPRPILPGSPEATVLSRLAPPPKTQMPGAQEMADKAITALVDDLHPLKRLEIQATGGRMDTPNSPYDNARLSRGASGMATHFLRDGTFDYNTLETTGPSLEQVLKPIEKNKERFKAYAIARRSKELEGRGITTGVDQTAAQQTIDNNADLAPVFDEALTYQKETLRYLKDAGILSEDAYQAMLDANQDYVPFYRMTADAAKGAGRGLRVHQPVRAIKGSDLPIVDPLESIIKNTHLYVTLAERNRALRSLKDMPGVEDYMQKVPPPAHAITVTDTEIARFLDEHGLPPDLAEPMEIFRRGAHTVAPDEIALWDNGKKEIYRVDPQIAETIKALDAPSMETWKRLLSIPARTLRAGVTLSPEYYIRNVLTKDQLAGFIQSKNGFKPVYDMLKGMWEAAKRGPEFQKWAKGGGMQSALIAMDRNYSASDMMRLAHDRTWLQKAANVITHPVQMLRIVNEAMDTGTRLGEFMRANRGSNDPNQIRRSALDARNVTQDFQRVGAKIKGINSLSAFLNGQIQGMSREIETVGGALRKPTTKEAMGTMARVAGSLTLPSLMLWYANRGDPRWEEAQDWEKDAYWFLLPEDKEAPPYRVAKPFTYGMLFGSLPERIMSGFADDNPRAFENFGRDMLGAVTPPMLPTFAVPVLEGITNYDFFTGAPVIPERLENEPSAQQFTGSTSEIAKLIGKGVAMIPGMDDKRLASPMVIDNAIRDWTGDIGKDAVSLTNPLLRSKDEPSRPSKMAGDNPILRAFISRYPSANSQPMDDVFDLMTRVRKGLTPDPNGELKRAEGAMRSGFKQIRDIEASRDLDPDAKRSAIDRLYLQMRGEAAFALRAWRAGRIEDKARTKDDAGASQAENAAAAWKAKNKQYIGINEEEAPLFMELEKLGIKIDRRWGVETLKRKLQEAKSKKSPQYGGTQ